MVIAVLLVERLHRLIEVHTFAAIRACHLADEHRSHDRILIARMTASQVTIALFEAEDEAVELSRLFQLTLNATEIFEAREHPLELYAMISRDRIDDARRNDGGDRERTRRHLAQLGAHAAEGIE